MISLAISEMIEVLLLFLREIPSFCAGKSWQFHARTCLLELKLKACTVDLSSREITNKTVLKRVVLVMPLSQYTSLLLTIFVSLFGLNQRHYRHGTL